MSQNKLPCRKKVTQTEFQRTKGHRKKMSQAKTSQKHNETCHAYILSSGKHHKDKMTQETKSIKE